MFFMGGMTLGYLHPPVRAKRTDANSLTGPDEEFVVPQHQKSPPVEADGALERTLLWARRILC